MIVFISGMIFGGIISFTVFAIIYVGKEDCDAQNRQKEKKRH